MYTLNQGHRINGGKRFKVILLVERMISDGNFHVIAGKTNQLIKISGPSIKPTHK